MEQKGKANLDPAHLTSWTISDFLRRLASEEPVPGGGSASALAGALGAALIVMYSKLGTVRKGVSSDDQEVLQKIALEASAYQQKLTRLVTEDSIAYGEVMQAFKLPKTTDEETKSRQQAIQKAFQRAVETPLQILNCAIECLYLTAEVALSGNPSAFSDLKVAQYLCLAAARGAIENVEINLPSLKDAEFLKQSEDRLNKLKTSLDKASNQKLTKPS